MCPKGYRTAPLLLLAVFILHDSAWPCFGALKGEAEGEVIRVEGRAWVQREAEEDRETPLLLGELLYGGDVARTEEGSEVQIAMADGSQLVVRSGSQVKMNDSRLTEGSTSSVSLFFGRLWCKVARLAKARSFHVETPMVVAGVRGTRFEVASFDDGTTLVGVEEGEVRVSADSEEVTVSRGQAVEAEYGLALAKPVPFDGSPGFWEGWRERRMKMVPRVLPRVAQKMQERLGHALETSRNLHGELVRISTQIRQMMEEMVRLKKEGRRPGLRRLRERLQERRERMMLVLQRLERVDNRLAAAAPMVKKLRDLAERFRGPLGPAYREVSDRIHSIERDVQSTREVRRENRRAIRENRRRIQELRATIRELE